MSSINPFHAASDAVEQRPASDVFKSSATQQASGISSRFASSGKHTIETLDEGDDAEHAAAAEPEFDPDDKRSLYDRLKAQKDAKDEEFQRTHTFKNQMDHWRLDEDEAAFEEERMAKIRAEEAEAARLNEEGAQFYKLARAQQDRTALPGAKPAIPPPSRAASEQLKRKQPMASAASALPGLKVLKVQPRAASAAPAAAESAAPAPAPPAGLLPGMGAYDDDSDDDDE